MGMGGGGGRGEVTSDINVTPMADVMLVLLIIFMVVTPALLAGFNATPPQAVNLKDHPEDANLDQVLGLDREPLGLPAIGSPIGIGRISGKHCPGSPRSRSTSCFRTISASVPSL